MMLADYLPLVRRAHAAIVECATHWCVTFHRQLVAYVTNVLEHLVLITYAYIALCLLLYALILRWRTLRFQRDVSHRPQRVLFVIAHPDDETMFFGPTVLRFTQDPNAPLVYLACLSPGAAPLSRVRKKELYAACRILGIRDECVLMHKHTLLPDAQDALWPPEVIARIVSHHVKTLSIDTLITFDRHGVSRHLNHCSIYYAIALLSVEGRLPAGCQVYVLESVNIVRKYWRLLDIPFSYVLSRVRFITTAHQRQTLRDAMGEHKSQMVWFRKLFLRFSRYQLINTLQRMDASDIQLDLDAAADTT